MPPQLRERSFITSGNVIVDPEQIAPTAHGLKAANGTPIAVLGEATLPIAVGKFRSTITGLVSEHVAAVMLGIEWLSENKLIWDFATNRVKLEGQHYPVHYRSATGNWCGRVVLQEDVVVPARTEVELSIKVIFRGRFDVAPDVQWGTETSPPTPGVHVVRTLMSGNILVNLPIRAVDVSPTAHPSRITVRAEVHPPPSDIELLPEPIHDYYKPGLPYFGGPADRALCANVTTGEIATMVEGNARELPGETMTNASPTQIVNGNGERILCWSLEGLCAAQRDDPDIAIIIRFLEEDPRKPEWDAVSLKSRDVKTLWQMWSRLAIRDGLLKRKFEAPDGLTVKWQKVWPKILREEFLKLAHGGMTSGHMNRRKTAAAVQSRAYTGLLGLRISTCS
jgi:hypothetical protein